MNNKDTLYIDGNSYFHKMNGSVKFILFILWYVLTFMFLDMRIFIVMLLLGAIMLIVSKIPFKNIKPLLYIMIGFNLINALFILLITPTHGSNLVESSTPILYIGYDTINLETIVYVLTLCLKYANLLPITLVFIFTTNPSSFASSLNKIGLPYKIAYSINIAFRYIPNVKKEFNTIMNAQQARGVSFKKGEASLSQRAKNVCAIGVPLLISSLNRIDVVTNAMDLRGFGKHSKRTWYNDTSMNKIDYITLLVCATTLAVAIYLQKNIFTDMWYPF